MSNKEYTVNLPQTNFPMKANSAVREVEIQHLWNEQKIYQRSIEQRKDSNKFVLHDGPPYLSSNKIHIGTALNKILKDIITKYKAQQGFYSPYVPGYDSHGLPIENAVLKDVKGGRQAFTVQELRRRCKEFALNNLKGQELSFRRLGVWGDWEHPYITLDAKFEAAQVRVFGKMAEAGYLYKGFKPVYWCANCETALAEAEVEYADHVSDSIFVKFPLKDSSKARLPNFVDKNDDVFFVIWTTTPWTLPANLGIALNPNFKYHFLKTKEQGILVVADQLKDAFLSTIGLNEEQVKSLGTEIGANLEKLECQHPLFDRTSLVILGEHVTGDSGTGCVHTAPGHGLEDFEIGSRYKLGVISILDSHGVLTDEAGNFAGLRYNKANAAIIDKLKELGYLLHHSSYQHSYPHCWRCKKPVVYRATEQWFASVSGFRKKALEAIDQVTWLPASGRNRIFNMVENRTDWCISRQRTWGVPIPVFYCKQCHHPMMNKESIESVAKIFEKESSDSWWEKEASYFIPASLKCTKCNTNEFEKETDIMDVWFDSGVTHSAVLDGRPELKGTPCELYLEGSDQHRGWFQSSLLTSVAVKGHAPYKTVLTHGFVVDETGRKMSKSLGNVVDPDDVIKQHGADVLRLWAASVNYTDDIPVGKNMLVQLAEVYRKLRNTARYLLGNLHDFNLKTDYVPYEKLTSLDAFILHRLQETITQVIIDFDKFEFFKYYQLLQNFCVVDLSSFYFDIVKDRLYTAGKNSLSRRSVQTVLYEVLQVLVRILVPVTPHLAEDIWQHVPETMRGKYESVLLTDFPNVNQQFIKSELSSFWQDLIKVRYVVNKALELVRAERKIGSSLEAQVELYIEDPNLKDKVLSLKEELPGLFITSQVIVLDKLPSTNSNALAQVNESGIVAFVLPAAGAKCARCWKFREDIGQDKKYADICLDCAKAINESTDILSGLS